MWEAKEREKYRFRNGTLQALNVCLWWWSERIVSHLISSHGTFNEFGDRVWNKRINVGGNLFLLCFQAKFLKVLFLFYFFLCSIIICLRLFLIGSKKVRNIPTAIRYEWIMTIFVRRFFFSPSSWLDAIASLAFIRHNNPLGSEQIVSGAKIEPLCKLIQCKQLENVSVK